MEVTCVGVRGGGGGGGGGGSENGTKLSSFQQILATRKFVVRIDLLPTNSTHWGSLETRLSHLQFLDLCGRDVRLARAKVHLHTLGGGGHSEPGPSGGPAYATHRSWEGRGEGGG